MNTSKIYSAISDANKVSADYLKKYFSQRTFVIGVKGTQAYSVNNLEKMFPDNIKIERLPETYNPKYSNLHGRNLHMLQPMWITWVEKNEVKE